MGVAPNSSTEKRARPVCRTSSAALRIDAAYRAWARNKVDLGKLRELQAAISDVLNESFAGQR